VNFNAKDAKGIRKGAQRKLSSATFAQNFATLAVKFNDSLRLKLVLTQPLNRSAIFAPSAAQTLRFCADFKH
jgi:hypothetical protein